MPLAFLVPAFLAGLLALGVPLILHLRRRDRQKPTPFPSLMFLSRLPIRTERRRRITDWPLLLLRALIILLLVAAFARPFLRTGDATETGTAGLTVLLLDRSASMAAEGTDAAWQDSLRVVLDRVPEGRRMAVIAFDAEATVVVPPTVDRGAVRAGLQQLPPPGGPTRFGAGLRAAAGLLAGERVPGEVIVLSDLQRTGRSTGAPPALPAGTVVHTVAVRPSSLDNVGVVDVQVEPVGGGELRRAVIEARLARSGGDSVRHRTVSLLLDGRTAATKEVDIAGEAGLRVRFDTVAFSRADARMEVRITPQDGFPVDDHFVGVIPAMAPVRVILVAPPDVRRDEIGYLESALAIGTEPTFGVKRVPQLTTGMLTDADVVILYDTPYPAGGTADATTTWLKGGGGLLVWPGDRLARKGTFGSELISEITLAKERRGETTVVGGAVLSHPALEAVREAGAAGLSQLHLRRVVRFTPGSGLDLLARFDDGSPALAAGSIGQGRVMISAIPADLARGDFPLQPLFLPFVRGVTGWAATATPRPLAHRAGEAWLLPGRVEVPILKAPDGSSVRVDAARSALTLRSSGFTELHDGRTSGIPIATLAVNLPPEESDLAPMPADELLLGVTEMSATDRSAELAPTEVARSREARQANWRWLLLLLLVAVVGEVFLASRGWRGIAPPSIEGTTSPGGRA